MGLPSLQNVFMMLPGVLMGLAFHEFGHAWVATLFGDDTPRRMGRVTLNPLAHLDWLGTILIFFAGFGWAKPVQVNISRLRPRVLGDICVSLAGVAMNFLIAVIFYATLVLIVNYGMLGDYHNPSLNSTLFWIVRINLALVAFNLIPLPPLDGFHVIRYLFPRGSERLYATIAQAGPFLLLLFFVIPGLTSRVLVPVHEALGMAVDWLVSLVL